MKSGIYQIYNVSNDKRYIGQATNINNRLKNHKAELSQNRHNNKVLQEEFNKYGVDAFVFERIHICNEEFLNVMEKFFIDKYNTTHNGYNIKGGNRSINQHLKEEHERKLKQERELKLKLEIENYNSNMEKLIDEIREIEIEIDICKLEYDFYVFIVKQDIYCYDEFIKYNCSNYDNFIYQEIVDFEDKYYNSAFNEFLNKYNLTALNEHEYEHIIKIDRTNQYISVIDDVLYMNFHFKYKLKDTKGNDLYKVSTAKVRVLYKNILE